MVRHLDHLALAVCEELRDGAEVFLRAVDGQLFERLVDLAVDCLGDNLRLTDGELEALATHLLDEDGESELSTTLDLPRIGATDVEDLERDVTDELLVEASLDHARGQLVALDAADERRRVGADGDRDGRLVDGDAGQRHRVLQISEGVADHDVREACDCDDVACDGDLCRERARRRWW